MIGILVAGMMSERRGRHTTVSYRATGSDNEELEHT